MKATISNFRGLADLRAGIAPILLLAGPNGAGKSSGCSAIAAAASGTLLPFDGLTKKAAGLLVRDGADLASVLLETMQGTATVFWPAVERQTTGAWHDISPAAAGLIDIAGAKPADRAALLINLIGALPTADDLKAALEQAKVAEAFTTAAIAQIARGWDAAHAYFKEGGAKIKGKWEQTTGERYGKAKAAGWRPAGWNPTLENANTEDLAQAVADADAAWQEANRSAGAGQVQLDAWHAEIGTLASRRDKLDAARKDVATEKARASSAKVALDTLGSRPNPGATPLACPCCKAGVRLKDDVLVPASAQDFAEQTKALAKYGSVLDVYKKAQAGLEMAERYFEAAERDVKAAERAEKALIEAAKTTTSEDDLVSAKDALAAAQSNRDRHRYVVEAKEFAAKIEDTMKVIDLLDKTGLRQTKLVEAIGAFNGRLVEVCTNAGWKPVHVDADMGVTYGGRLLALCSAGEQYRARITLQLAVAGAEGAPMVVIDGADILDKAGRNGMFGAIKKSGLSAVIGMTLLKHDDMPNLARAGLGESVWIVDGVGTAAMKEAA